MSGLYTAVQKVLTKYMGCMQKHKLQKDVRVEHCFYPREKGRVSQIVHLDLAGPLPSTKAPANIRECQMEENKILDEDLDEEAVEPLVEPEESQAQMKYIQCLEIVLCSMGTEEVAVHE